MTKGNDKTEDDVKKNAEEEDVEGVDGWHGIRWPGEEGEEKKKKDDDDDDLNGGEMMPIPEMFPTNWLVCEALSLLNVGKC